VGPPEASSFKRGGFFYAQATRLIGLLITSSENLNAEAK